MKRTQTTQGVGFVLVLGCRLWAQTLSIAPSTVTRGGSGSLLVTLVSPQAKAPVALQWEFTFPQSIVVDAADIAVGTAAESAQKALTCRAVEKTLYRCILAGGQKPIPNGPVAGVRYRVPPEVRQIVEKVRIGKAMGATAAAEKVEIEDAQATITVK